LVCHSWRSWRHGGEVDLWPPSGQVRQEEREKEELSLNSLDKSVFIFCFVIFGDLGVMAAK
jgi:hypothetical protein